MFFLRICELANHCCVIKNERGFNIRIDIEENKILVNNIKNYFLTRKIQDHVGHCRTIEKIYMFRIYKL